MATPRAKPGDCLRIPLSNRRYAYAHYLLFDDREDPYSGYGALFRVFKLQTEAPLEEPSSLSGTPELFPPVYVGGLVPAVRSGRWRVIGKMPVDLTEPPPFRESSASTPGHYDDWRIVHKGVVTFVGELPEKLRSLEFRGIWGTELLEKRIVSGHGMFDEVL